jgi:hypothetical protein
MEFNPKKDDNHRIDEFTKKLRTETAYWSKRIQMALSQTDQIEAWQFQDYIKSMLTSLGHLF